MAEILLNKTSYWQRGPGHQVLTKQEARHRAGGSPSEPVSPSLLSRLVYDSSLQNHCQILTYPHVASLRASMSRLGLWHFLQVSVCLAVVTFSFPARKGLPVFLPVAGFATEAGSGEMGRQLPGCGRGARGGAGGKARWEIQKRCES